MHPRCLEVIDPFPLPEAMHDLIEFVEQLWWNKKSDGLPNDLLGSIPVESLRSRIPARDDSIKPLANDGIVRRVHKRSQPQPRLFWAYNRSHERCSRVTWTILCLTA
jgi:hypothetical protein